MNETGVKGSILIIDDDDGILSTLTIVLKRYFDRVVVGNTPHKITQFLQQESFGVVLLDMNFVAGQTSGKEGFQWLTHIQTMAPGTSVVMMTAYGDIDLAIRAMKQGATDFVVKPWDNDQLISVLLGAIKKSHFQEPRSSKQASKSEEVERIFMFLDLKDSTQLAERLGHVRYFSLLSDFFSDIADPIEQCEGEIYQYVGDEVVVSWSRESGIRHSNCLKSFFIIQDLIQEKATKYQERYGFLPRFKAGMHHGTVAKGTIGKVKQEIVYTGDVLNTTSRIEGLCNTYQVPLLISSDLLQLLQPEELLIEIHPIGQLPLRGREVPVSLFSICRSSAKV